MSASKPGGRTPEGHKPGGKGGKGARGHAQSLQDGGGSVDRTPTSSIPRRSWLGSRSSELSRRASVHLGAAFEDPPDTEEVTCSTTSEPHPHPTLALA